MEGTSSRALRRRDAIVSEEKGKGGVMLMVLMKRSLGEAEQLR
jgi:hypothetical protein